MGALARIERCWSFILSTIESASVLAICWLQKSSFKLFLWPYRPFFWFWPICHRCTMRTKPHQCRFFVNLGSSRHGTKMWSENVRTVRDCFAKIKLLKIRKNNKEIKKRDQHWFLEFRKLFLFLPSTSYKATYSIQEFSHILNREWLNTPGAVW